MRMSGPKHRCDSAGWTCAGADAAKPIKRRLAGPGALHSRRVNTTKGDMGCAWMDDFDSLQCRRIEDGRIPCPHHDGDGMRLPLQAGRQRCPPRRCPDSAAARPRDHRTHLAAGAGEVPQRVSCTMRPRTTSGAPATRPARPANATWPTASSAAAPPPPRRCSDRPSWIKATVA